MSPGIMVTPTTPLYNAEGTAGFLEHQAGFEPAALRFCRPSLWATQALMHLFIILTYLRLFVNLFGVFL